jgi:hypothetical protein
MRADADLFMAYEYGTAVGLPASAVLKLSRAEMYGYLAHQSLKREMLE